MLWAEWSPWEESAVHNFTFSSADCIRGSCAVNRSDANSQFNWVVTRCLWPGWQAGWNGSDKRKHWRCKWRANIRRAMTSHARTSPSSLSIARGAHFCVWYLRPSPRALTQTRGWVGALRSRISSARNNVSLTLARCAERYWWIDKPRF